MAKRGLRRLGRGAARSLFGCALALGLVTGAVRGAPVPDWSKASWDDYLAQKARAHGGTAKTAGTIPDWSGLWIRDSHKIPASFDGLAGPNPDIPKLGVGRSTALLTPPYEAAFRQKLDELKQGKEWDRQSYCLPAGYPRMLAEPFMREFIVTPKEVWMTHEQVNETRRIYVDGRAHVDDDTPLWLGDAIGFWDGDTLVVHTNHVKAGSYQRGQPDYSFHTSTVERIHKVAPDQIDDEITVYDPDGLRQPWHTVFNYKKLKDDPSIRVNYAACEENNNVYRAEDGSTQYLLPGDKGYRDPTFFGIPDVAKDSLPQ